MAIRSQYLTHGTTIRQVQILLWRRRQILTSALHESTLLWCRLMDNRCETEFVFYVVVCIVGFQGTVARGGDLLVTMSW